MRTTSDRTHRTPIAADSPLSCLIGAHFSIAKGLDQALYDAKDYRCTACQIFTKNATAWKERDLSPDEIRRFRQAMADTGIRQIASHAAYLINLATPDKKKHALSCHALEKELIRSSDLSIPYVVLHPGGHMGKGEKEGIRRVTESIASVLLKTPDLTTRLLLETTSGQGSSVGYTFEQLAAIMDGIDDHDRIGICIDSCHIFAAGYDIRTWEEYEDTLSRFISVIGLERLFLIHLNDTKKPFGTRVDRHEHIGEGFIGLKAFAYFMNDTRLSDIPKIIETPKSKGRDWDSINLEKLRQLIRTRCR